MAGPVHEGGPTVMNRSVELPAWLALLPLRYVPTAVAWHLAAPGWVSPRRPTPAFVFRLVNHQVDVH